MLSLTDAVTVATEVIDSCKAPVAIFLIGGEIKFTKSTSKLYERRMDTMRGNLVGVYRPGADARHVREDLAEFYCGRAA